MGFDLAFSAFVSGLISRFFVAPIDVIKIRSQITSAPLKGQIKSILQNEGVLAFWKGNIAAELLYGSYSMIQMTAYKKLQHMIPAENQFIKNFQSGALAGVLATVVTFPFDVLRTRFAAQVTPVYYSLFGAVRTILKEETLGLYKGLGPSIVAIIPYMGITFASYEYYKKMLSNTGLSSYNDLISGALAGLSGKLSTYPLDTLRKRMQIQGPRVDEFLSDVKVANYNNLKRMKFTNTHLIHIGFAFRIFEDIIRSEGIGGLFRGIKPALLKAVIGSSLTFSLTNYFKSRVD
eukprot:NODE_157_length_16664_cov_0.301781.p6 type:complete len:291 gc:universal NODE_157_length_16664_cov_0.301781:10365-11237(+)